MVELKFSTQCVKMNKSEMIIGGIEFIKDYIDQNKYPNQKYLNHTFNNNLSILKIERNTEDNNEIKSMKLIIKGIKDTIIKEEKEVFYFCNGIKKVKFYNSRKKKDINKIRSKKSLCEYKNHIKN
jgi:hypothetical protein